MIAVRAPAGLGPPAGTPSGGELELFWDWRAATGTSTTALQDGGKIPYLSNADGLLSIIANPGNLGFPAEMENLLQITHNDEDNGLVGSRGDIDDDTFAAVGIGETQNRRYYIRVDWPDGADIGPDHGFQSNVGVIQFMHVIPGGSAGTINFDIDNQTISPYRVNIAKGKCWRLELGLTRFDADECTIVAELFDESVSLTVPVYDSTDFVNTGTGDNLTEANFPYSDADVFFRNWMFGISGQAGVTYTGGTLYVGGFAVSRNGPIGAYPHPDEA